MKNENLKFLFKSLLLPWIVLRKVKKKQQNDTIDVNLTKKCKICSKCCKCGDKYKKSKIYI